ncbi:hypothetical protein [Streptomyces sp. NPDC056641]|uniref:hypothetical protein n=1 Tax=unclassified Streptomyces TaxID=2593676 RepID=UPI0036979944
MRPTFSSCSSFSSRSSRPARTERLRRVLTLGVTAATAIVPAALSVLPALTPEARAAQATQATRAGSAAQAVRATAVPVTTAGAREPRCGDVFDRDFPIEARIHGGPAGFRPGGGPGAWYLDLTNTTDADCQHIHPVVVLADRDRTLAVSQVTLQIRPATSGDGGRWRTLSLEKTDEDEIVGVLNDGFPGFVIPGGRTVTISARLAFAADTRPNRVLMSAATVQRRGRDGDWVGESNPYGFAIGAGGVNGDKEKRTDAHARASTAASTAPGSAGDSVPDSAVSTAPDSGSGVTRPPGPIPPSTATPGARSPFAPSAPSDPSDPSEPPPALARTGTGGDLTGRIAAAAALLTAGVVLVLGVRRLRAGRL